MSGRRSPAVRCLLVTPATRFGSWAWFDKVIRASAPDVEWLVVSYGRPPDPPPNARFVALPETDYGRLGRLMAGRRLLALNVLYYVPLVPVALVRGLAYRPHVAVANGLLPAAVLLPFRLLGARLLLAFHGYMGHAGTGWRALLRTVLGRVDEAFVNSEGSAEDLGRLLPSRRITVVRHWADARFFAVPLERSRAERLRVLFVGRLDGEKFSQCLRVCRRLAREGVVELRAVGGGELAGSLEGDGLVGLGYVADLDELASIYGSADVVWAPADTTYLSLPGVEGLAAGCPLVVSDIPAVDRRAEAGIRVPRTLLPASVGTVVDGHDDEEALALLRRLASEGVPAETRRRCRAYAEELHSPANLELVVSALRPRG